MPGGNLNYAFVVRDDKNAVFCEAGSRVHQGGVSKQTAGEVSAKDTVDLNAMKRSYSYYYSPKFTLKQTNLAMEIHHFNPFQSISRDI